MADLQQDIVDSKGKKLDQVKLDSEAFAAPLNKKVVHSVVRWQRASKRAGTHSCLNRSKMEGGGRKPHKQKGSGRARAGSNNSPVWVGGAVSHGPSPKSYEFKLTKGTKKLALAAALTDKNKTDSLVVVDSLEVKSGKTKDMVSLLKSLGLDSKRKILIVTSDKDTEGSIQRSSKNIPGVTALSTKGLNVYDLINANVLVATKDSIVEIQERIKKQVTKED